MKVETLVERIVDMKYEDLLKRIQNIREVRIDATSAAAMKPARKTRNKKSDVDKLLDKMSPEERKKLLEMLGNED